MKKVLFWVSVSVLAILFGGAAFLALKQPAQRPAPDLKLEATPERLTRGKYLVDNVANCLHCHSQTDKTRFGLPIVPGTEGAGGECLGPDVGFDGLLCVPNITPDVETGIGGWSDGELVRAIREGVDREGRALFPMMPFDKYRRLSDEDTYAIVVYLRQLPARRTPRQERKLPFPLPVVLKFLPSPLEGPVAPPADERLARGHYLADIGGCTTCHTPTDAQHAPLEGKLLAGGQEFPVAPGAVVRSSNITFHPTGLGELDEETFKAVFKAGLGEPRAVAPSRNTIMPWSAYAHLSDTDLSDLYAWLRTVPPQDHKVDPWGPPAQASDP